MMRTTLLWFRRDLRLYHNQAFEWACENADKILPVYIHAADEEAPWQPGAASRWWLEQSLKQLETGLAKHGLVLHYFSGDSLKTLQSLATQTGADSVAFNELYEPHLHQRDTQVTAALKEHNIDVRTFASGLFFRPGTLLNNQNLPYRVYTPFAKKIRVELSQGGTGTPDQPIRRRKIKPAELNKKTALTDLQLNAGFNWHTKLHDYWQPGEGQAHQRLTEFLQHGLQVYDSHRDIPALDGTSALSAHLHFGEITVEQIYWQLQPALDAQFGENTRLSAERYLNQLIWREFAHHILWHFPHTANQPMNERYSSNFWHRPGDEFTQWTRGKTGIPIIDAGMKQLWETGWMHNRVRMIVASFLTKNLGCHWLAGARWFWDTLIDADLANNSMGWQWVAGCGVDAAPYYRIFNPLTQTRRFDSELHYVHRWLPASSHSDYPPPMINLDESRRHALQQYKDLISTPGSQL
jgi:deoxyribodipyrimidine photo-lyase